MTRTIPSTVPSKPDHGADRADQREIAQPLLELHVLFFAHFLHGFDGLRVAGRKFGQARGEDVTEKNRRVWPARTLPDSAFRSNGLEASTKFGGQTLWRRIDSTFMTINATKTNEMSRNTMV